MDWLRRHHAMIVYDEKLVRVPFGNETLVFRGAESYIGRKISTDDFLMSKTYLSSKTFLKVLSEKLPGLPPARPIEFHIDQIPGVAPVARAPYHLTPSEMKELSEQLHELFDKGFCKTQFLT
nr:hypothetical protein [Tanacetum cinerariifolium]